MTDNWKSFGVDAASASRRVTQCGVGRLLDAMAATEKGLCGPDQNPELPRGATAAVVAALANPDISSSGLLTALRERLDASWSLPLAQTIQRHRKGSCGCAR